ncbi:hypothetical protein [Nocardioides sp.]|uniref:hypothetical protein n=1 Tax=Nocardioides sp. TaxID=35761 RepID=UPI00352815CE
MALIAATMALVTLLGLAWAVGHGGEPGLSADGLLPPAAAEAAPPAPQVTGASPPLRSRRPPTLPGGGRRIFDGHRFLVAYYGTAGTGSLGVLGETSPDRADARLRRAAAPYRRPGERIQPVYELIVTVADRSPGPDGDYSHDISRARVRQYLAAARRHGALVVLDLQPGRSGFLTVARRWAWALRDPRVGLALDPEWRMGPRQVPGRRVGSVSAAEVNRTAAWLSGLVRRERLPEKLFVLHQFRTSMITDPGAIRRRPGLAMVQHVDGFGTQRQKLGTFHAVARPRQFHLGLKLFYDEDRHLMTPARVRAIRPRVRFVSYQ